MKKDHFELVMKKQKNVISSIRGHTMSTDQYSELVNLLSGELYSVLNAARRDTLAKAARQNLVR